MITCFTIATNKYLKQALTLAKSVLKYNGNYTFIIALLDVKPSYPLELPERIDILEVHKMQIKEFATMQQIYNAFEMSCALKPFIAEYISKTNDTEKIIYLDADILVFDSFKVMEKDEFSSFSITPHCTSFKNKEDNYSMELTINNHGLYNAGFFSFNTRNNESFEILKWWQNVLLTECRVNLCTGHFVDQIWLNYLPLYFDQVNIIKDVGYNVALWNLSERNLKEMGDTFLINNIVPLVFFHFTGYDFEIPETLSKTHTQFSLHDKPELESLFSKYGKELAFQPNIDTSINFYKNFKLESKERISCYEKILYKIKQILN